MNVNDWSFQPYSFWLLMILLIPLVSVGQVNTCKSLRGRVVEQFDSYGIKDATVRIDKYGAVTTTEEDGSFVLELDFPFDSDLVLEVEKLSGYQPLKTNFTIRKERIEQQCSVVGAIKLLSTQPTYLQGRITDQDSRQPIDSVLITIGNKRTYSSDSGTFNIPIRIEPGKREKLHRIWINIHKPSYEIIDESRFIQKDSDSVYFPVDDIQLKFLGDYPIRGKVVRKRGSKKPIPDVTVSIPTFDVDTQSDSTGKFQFVIPREEYEKVNGKFEIEFSKEKFRDDIFDYDPTIPKGFKQPMRRKLGKLFLKIGAGTLIVGGAGVLFYFYRRKLVPPSQQIR